MPVTTYNLDCRFFTGYKPCKFKRPCDGCPEYQPVKTRIGIVSLEALGAVLRSTVLLAPLKRKYPQAHITWITYPGAKALLDNNPEIDRIVVVDGKTEAVLNHLEFDVLCAVDKSIEAGALAERIKAKQKFGFGLTTGGVIRPMNPEAQYQYDLGLDDHQKFFVNQKAETQQTTESMGLKWERDPYILQLTPAEVQQAQQLRAEFKQSARGIIGFNTGCSILYSYKKFTVERSIETIAMWRKQFPHMAVALLGGREDHERQAAMKAAFANDPLVVNTPTTGGLRSGVVSMATADMVFSGCSLGLHIAIALKKPTVCWFGVSCSQEIDLYDRGVKLQAEVTCSPCWRKTCDNEPKCYNQVAPDKIGAATSEVLAKIGLT